MLFLSLRALHVSFAVAVYLLLWLHGLFENTAPIAAVFLPILACTTPTTATAAVIHLPIQRRGGSFKPYTNAHNMVDMEALYGELQRLDVRFNQTAREFKGNRIVRTAKKNDASRTGGEGIGLMGDIQMDGAWLVAPLLLKIHVSELNCFYQQVRQDRPWNPPAGHRGGYRHADCGLLCLGNNEQERHRVCRSILRVFPLVMPSILLSLTVFRLHVYSAHRDIPNAD